MVVKINDSWEKVLKNEFEKPYFNELMDFIKKEYHSKENKIFPHENQIFRALELCPLEKVKVVILGQDPYPTKGYAHGFCFSVEEHVKPFPKSLNNIFKEIQSDLGIGIPADGSLIKWAEQGVLLLNTILTVEEGRPESHSNKGWELFTDAIIKIINQNCNGIVFILWGKKAQKKAGLVDNNKNLILNSAHPSPLSAHRGFFGSKQFSQTNTYLLIVGKTPINW